MHPARILALAGVIGIISVAPAAHATATAAPAADTAVASDPARAHAIVEHADEIRFPRDSFEVDVSVSSVVDGQPQDPRRYRVLSKGPENSVVMTLDPPDERGQNMLLKGRELWIFLPDVSQPVRLSLSQRLTGQVANGDLVRANLAGDYDARIAGVERIGGKDHYVLDLTAAQRGVTYAKVRYWVRVADYFPYKAEFYSTSGRLLKTCTYERFQPLGGRVRPTRLVITDALKSGDRSVMEYSALKHVDLPDRLFSKDYLKKLE